MDRELCFRPLGLCLAEPALFGPGPNRLAWVREELFDQPLISVWQAQWGLNEVWPGEPHMPKTPLIKDRALCRLAATQQDLSSLGNSSTGPQSALGIHLAHVHRSCRAPDS